ncbi:MAG: hypothetical protein EBQ59_08500 [Verrucomicrobia bacterium]|nr:hypothetical protein [Verrucomicrobiota bacterium]
MDYEIRGLRVAAEKSADFIELIALAEDVRQSGWAKAKSRSWRRTKGRADEGSMGKGHPSLRGWH